MLRSLRVQFILSHTLPIVLLLPLLSLTLLYLLHTRYFLTTLAEELVVQAHMLTGLVSRETRFWQEPTAAQEFIETVGVNMTARIVLVDQNRQVFAVTRAEQPRRSDVVTIDIVDDAFQGRTAWRARYSTNMDDEIIDVAVPVVDASGQVIGVIRLSQSLEPVQSRLTRLTWYIATVSGFAILAALALALFLARALGVPLLRFSRAVSEFRDKQEPLQLPAQGPTEIRRLATTFNGMAAEIVEQNVVRRRLLASIVHEMSRPLGGVNAAAQYLKQHSAAVSPSLLHELSTDIVTQVGQMSRQIDDLTLLSQAQTGDIILDLQPISLAPLCQEELRHVAALAKEKRITLVVELDPTTPPILADPRRIAQIIGNLLHNAVKYTPPGGQIHAAVCPVVDDAEQPAAELRVRDSGPGIDIADQPFIFDPFYRSPEHRPLQQGLGLGLAVARRLAEAHGGELRVQSTLGAGATFSLRLPQTPPSLGA